MSDNDDEDGSDNDDEDGSDDNDKDGRDNGFTSTVLADVYLVKTISTYLHETTQFLRTDLTITQIREHYHLTLQRTSKYHILKHLFKNSFNIR